MADENNDQEKTEEPSQYRIDEFRKKGEVASSKELTSILVLSGTLLTLILSVVYLFETCSEFFFWIFAQDATKMYSDKMLAELLEKSLITMFKCVAPTFVSALCVGVLSQVMQIGILYAPDALSMKFERVNPLSGFKRIFSKKSVVEALKGLLKFGIVCSISYVLLKDELPTFIGFLQADTIESFLYLKTMMAELAFSIIGGLIVVVLTDFAWEKYSYKQKLMMTKQQAKEESKDKEGNPEIRQRIRSIQRDIATKKMMSEIPKADVIVANPTHFSVAIKYDNTSMISPEVVAKGADNMALKIREIAKKHNIPVVENIYLARSLFNTVDIGKPVPRDMYKAVAEVLAFVYRLKEKQRAIS